MAKSGSNVEMEEELMINISTVGIGYCHYHETRPKIVTISDICHRVIVTISHTYCTFLEENSRDSTVEAP